MLLIWLSKSVNVSCIDFPSWNPSFQRLSKAKAVFLSTFQAPICPSIGARSWNTCQDRHYRFGSLFLFGSPCAGSSSFSLSLLPRIRLCEYCISVNGCDGCHFFRFLIYDIRSLLLVCGVTLTRLPFPILMYKSNWKLSFQHVGSVIWKIMVPLDVIQNGSVLDSMTNKFFHEVLVMVVIILGAAFVH